MQQLEQFENGRATLIAALEDVRDGRRTDIQYDQFYYGKPGDNGQVIGCLSCIALILEQGIEQTRKDIEYARSSSCITPMGEYEKCAAKALTAGWKLLGLPGDSYGIFGTGRTWPDDLRVLYSNNRIEAAIQALNRLQPDGSIAESELPNIPAEPVRDSLLEEVLA